MVSSLQVNTMKETDSTVERSSYALSKHNVLFRRFYVITVGFALVLIFHMNAVLDYHHHAQMSSSSRNVDHNSMMQSHTMAKRRNNSNSSFVTDGRTARFRRKSADGNRTSMMSLESEIGDTRRSMAAAKGETLHKLKVVESQENNTNDGSPALVHFYNGTQNCIVDPSTIELLGQGCDGAVYSAEIKCGSQKETMAIKLFTRGNKSIPISQRENERKMMYNAIAPSDGESANKLDNFVISRGLVKFPRSLIPQLTSMMTQPKRIIEMYHEDGTVIDGSVMSMAGGDSLHKLSLRAHHYNEAIPRPKQYHMVQSLLDVYHHMMNHRVAHCDISSTHVLVTPEGDIRLIDFERVFVLDRNTHTSPLRQRDLRNSQRIQRNQVWQLYTLLTVVCQPRDFKHVSIPNNVCVQKEAVDSDVVNKFVSRQLKPALRRCGFAGGSSLLQESSSLLEQIDKTSTVMDALRDLAQEGS